jgi:hypothetical protein
MQIGRGLYAEALRYFSDHSDIASEAVGTYFWAMEEQRIGSPTAILLMQRVEKLAGEAGRSELVTLARQHLNDKSMT